MCPSNLTWGSPYALPILSIETNHELQRFRYSPDFSQCGQPEYCGSVSIPMTGSRADDFKLCNEKAGYTKTPTGYTWHHKYMAPSPTGNICEMQLVETAYHRKTCCHIGGFGQYVSLEEDRQLIAVQNRANAETLEYLFRQAKLLAGFRNEPIAAPLASADVEQLAESLEITLPTALCDFYRDGHKVTPDTPFLSAAGCTYLIASVYPLAFGGGAAETLQAVMEDERRRPGGPLLFARDGAVPIADDPFGNIYFLPPDEETVCFYDHECDMAFSTHIPVRIFMDNLYSKEA